MNFKKYYIMATLFYLISTSIYLTQNYHGEKHDLIKSVDKQLLTTAKSTMSIFHNDTHQKKPSLQDLKLLDSTNILLEHAQIMNVNHINVYTKQDDKITLTASSVDKTDLEQDNIEPMSSTLVNVFSTTVTTYDKINNNAEHFHSIYMPVVHENGVICVIEVSVEVSWLNKKINSILFHELLEAFVYFLVLSPFFLIYHQQMKKHKQNLKMVILERTKELEQQKFALNTHAIVSMTDIQGNITFVNKLFEKISGYSKKELLGKNHSMLCSNEHTQEFWKDMYKVVSSSKTWRADVCNKDKNGNIYWVDTSIIPLKNAHGNIESYISIRTDITALKQSNEQVIRKEELLQTLLDSVAWGMYGVDSVGNCTFVNQGFLHLLGYDNENEVIGKHIHELTHHTRKDGSPYPSHECKIYKVNQANMSAHADDEVFWKKDGTSIDVEYWSYPIVNDGVCVGAVATFSDISEKNQLEEEHKKQDKLMMQQSRLAQMGEMISMIAHQWRQPLGAIASTTLNMKFKIELESFDTQSPQGLEEMNQFFTEQLNSIESYAENLSSTINDFRNFHNSDKKMVVKTFEDITAKAIGIIQHSLEADKVQLVQEFHGDMSIEVQDGEILQVILNILKNSQDNFKEKMTTEPKISILVRNKVLFICDNGGGIEQAILDKIFDPYFSTKDEKNGTGLGLYMSKTIIEDHHGGKLLAYNKDDGVCFEINMEKTDA